MNEWLDLGFEILAIDDIHFGCDLQWHSGSTCYLYCQVLSFGKHTVGTTSSSKSVTLSNTGNGKLSITGIATTGGFSQTNACGGSVPARKSCAISVSFKPTVKGSVTGSLTINDNASSRHQVISLSGTGT